MLLHVVSALRFVFALALISSIACGGPEKAEPCTTDSDCEAGLCRARIDAEPVDLAALPLVCGEANYAVTGAPCCRRADDCARGICLVSGGCVTPCEVDADCAAAERCQDVYARVSESALQTLRACVQRVRLPSDVRVTETRLDDVLTTDPVGVSVDLPAIDGTSVFVFEHLSESLWPLTVECRSPLCVRSLETRDADPVVLFDAARVGGASVRPLNTINTDIDSWLSTLLLPNGPRAVLSDAGYQIRLRSESAGDLAVTQLDRALGGDVLDVHVYYVNTLELAPQGERGPEMVADALDHAETILTQAGITIGNVCQTEVVGGLRDQLATIDPPRFGLLQEVPALLALSAGAQRSEVAVFLVDQADVALGLTGGIPGPPGMHGTGSSGVVMSVLLVDSAQHLGKAMAHEIGHYLGLFHPQETDRTVLDPLPDTPIDASNLMGRSGPGEALTDNQRDVLQRSLLLY